MLSARLVHELASGFDRRTLGRVCDCCPRQPTRVSALVATLVDAPGSIAPAIEPATIDRSGLGWKELVSLGLEVLLGLVDTLFFSTSDIIHKTRARGLRPNQTRT